MADGKDIVDIVAKAKGGDRDAFGILYEEYMTPIYRFVYYKVGERRVSEDITQTAFLRAYEALPKYRETGAPYLAYLYRIARNLVTDHYRKKKDVLVEDFENAFANILDENDSAESAAEDRERKAFVARGLASLSDEQREVLVLRYMNDLSYKEISSALGKSEEALRALHHRAMVALRNLLSHVEV